MRDVYQHPTVAELAASLGAAGSGAAAAAEEAGEYRQARGGEYWLCGLLQAATYVAIVLITVRVLIEAIAWNAQARGFAELYLRCCVSGGLLFLLYAAVPIALKWVLVGRWKAGRIPIWSLGYYRFWLAKLLIQTNPLALFRGSPLYNVYLRLLGARIGANAFIDARLPPVCTDLVTIGAGAVIRKDALLPGYKAERGWIRTGRIRIGRDALIGNAAVLDIDTAVGEGAQLGHCSSLQEGETVPPGRRYHGSPAVETQVDYLGVAPRPCSRARRIAYSAAQIAALALLYLPAPFVLIFYWARHEIHADPLSPSWTHGLLVFSALVFAAVLVLRVMSSTLLPRLLARVFRDGTAYTLYGLRYGLLRLIQRLSNSYFLNALFGDSSAIVHYLKAVGYRMPRIVQTGSNFGMVQRHDVPTFCDVGPGTMVADGLSMINVLNSASSFRVCRASIGEKNYLGNLIVYPPDGRTGRNCLLATKTMIPIDGRVREDVGLLGSPAFEIPRAVARDRAFNRQVGEEARRRGLRAKNRHNLVTALLFLFFQWLYFYIAVALAHAGAHLDNLHGMAPWAVMAVLFPAFSILYFCALERASLGFGRIPPQTVSIYDAAFWRVERYWKLSESLVHHMFKGTPIRNVVTRLRGCRLGRRVFDDGALITEATLMEIGDHCTLNEAVLLQSHSLEEGVFKSDWVRIGAGCTVGCNALVHYGVVCGEGAVVDPDSFVMKGETVDAGARWQGNPATARTAAPALAVRAEREERIPRARFAVLPLP
jgi:non-ribosomal peptide synthetase-like protein